MKKIVFLGTQGSGKTHLIYKLIEQEEKSIKSTTGLEFYSKRIRKSNKDISFQFWDTSGNKRFRFFTTQPYLNNRTSLYLIAIDTTNPLSLEEAQSFLATLKKLNPSAPRLLIATKVDLKDQQKITKQDIKKFMRQNGIKGNFLTTSVHDKGSITKLLVQIIRTAKDPKIEQERKLPKIKKTSLIAWIVLGFITIGITIGIKLGIAIAPILFPVGFGVTTPYLAAALGAALFGLACLALTVLVTWLIKTILHCCNSVMLPKTDKPPKNTPSSEGIYKQPRLKSISSFSNPNEAEKSINEESLDEAPNKEFISFSHSY